MHQAINRFGQVIGTFGSLDQAVSRAKRERGATVRSVGFVGGALPVSR